VSKSELGFQIELNVDVLFSVFGLPPSVESIALLSAHNILNRVAVFVPNRVVRLARVAHEAFGCVACLAEHAIAFGLLETAR
jgi:hypothetical protein